MIEKLLSKVWSKLESNGSNKFIKKLEVIKESEVMFNIPTGRFYLYVHFLKETQSQTKDDLMDYFTEIHNMPSELICLDNILRVQMIPQTWTPPTE